jgi:5-formyltetrahydrofolate cyclo-ligase
MTKSEIRNDQKELRDRLTAEEHMILGSALLDKLLETEEYQNCSKVLTYLSFRSEVDTYDIIQYSIKLGKEVFIPKVEAKGLEFYRINHLEGLIQSKFGVLEPNSEEAERYYRDDSVSAENNPEVDNIRSNNLERSNPDEKRDPKYRDLMLLPGLAFDFRGNRIGYGAGYYDKYLATHRSESFYKIALAYDFQVVDRIPADEYDIRVDKIITPTRIITC